MEALRNKGELNIRPTNTPFPRVQMESSKVIMQVSHLAFLRQWSGLNNGVHLTGGDSSNKHIMKWQQLDP